MVNHNSSKFYTTHRCGGGLKIDLNALFLKLRVIDLPLNCLTINSGAKHIIHCGYFSKDVFDDISVPLGQRYSMPTYSSMPVLVVDDSATMGQIVSRILNQIGFHKIDIAANSSDALERLHRSSYSMVIADWNMQPMSGYDLLKEIRSDPALAHIRFLMISGNTSIDKVVAAKKANADSYLTKPFSAETLKVKIDEALKTWRRG